MSNLQTTGDMCLGAFMAGVVVSLAHLPGRAYTEFLCVFTAIGLIPFATTRARHVTCPHAPLLMSSGAFAVKLSVNNSTSHATQQPPTSTKTMHGHPRPV